MSKSRALSRKSSLKELGPGHPLYPNCDGKPWNNRGGDSQSTVKFQFVEAYFRINLAYAQLLAFRKKRRPPSATPKAFGMERTLLQQIEKAIVFREALEDRYAPRGILATPVYRDGFTVDVRFTDFQTGQQQGGPLIISSSSVRITIPLPAGLRSKLCKN
jgi:hypothetical protein